LRRLLIIYGIHDDPHITTRDDAVVRLEEIISASDVPGTGGAQTSTAPPDVEVIGPPVVHARPAKGFVFVLLLGLAITSPGPHFIQPGARFKTNFVTIRYISFFYFCFFFFL
jgi:hypothetical protein